MLKSLQVSQLYTKSIFIIKKEKMYYIIKNMKEKPQQVEELFEDC